MNFNLSKYKFYVPTNKDGSPKGEVIAVSTYAGRYVRGVAKLNPLDEFDIEAGKKLAAARCNAKIAQKRAKRAQKKILEATQQRQEAERFYQKMLCYYSDATSEWAEAVNRVDDFEKMLGE